MGDVSMNVTGLLPNISSLFNNQIFSDVEFIFLCNTGQTQKMYGHKLILALRSKVFASMFYNKRETLSQIQLPASKRSCFSLLLRFLYTDDVQFHTFQEAQDLYELADEYDVAELIEKCSDYILHDDLTIENVIPKYESALRKNIGMLLKECQDFVCVNTQLVLESVHFINASVKVMEDIIKQDNLSVSSELEVIGAVLKWGSQELKKKKMPSDEKYLRECINPFMKHIRFLTLSDTEFDFFVQNFNIFTGYESSILTRKIYQPQCNVDFPDNLCSITVKRAKGLDSKSMPLVLPMKNPLVDSFPKSKSPNSSMSVPHVSFPNGTSDYSFKMTSSVSSNKSKSTTYITDPMSKIYGSPESPTSQVNKISYHIKKMSLFNETNMSKSPVTPSQLKDTVNDQSQLKQTKFLSSPSIVDKTYFPPNNIHNNRLRDFEFPLLESEPCFRTSFQSDVKSTIVFKMKTGNIRLYGFELKIQNNNSESLEELDIDVDLVGFSKQPFSKIFKKELKNNVLALKFPEKMILQESRKGTLEVSIDNLLLNRCSTCNFSDNYELYSGLNFACDISLKSTKKADNGFIFLISKLIYMPC